MPASDYVVLKHGFKDIDEGTRLEHSRQLYRRHHGSIRRLARYFCSICTRSPATASSLESL